MNNSASSEQVLLTLKRHRPSRLDLSSAKKGRISETTIEEFTDTGKRVIGKPLLFQDGVGINWGRSPIQRFISEPTQNLFKAGNDASEVDSEMGHNNFNPIIIDDEFHSSVTQENNVTSARSNRSEDIPTWNGKTKAVDAATLEPDIIEISPTDSNEFDHEGIFVLQVMDQEFPEGLEAGRRINLVVIKDLPSYIISRDIARLLKDSGFISVVEEIVQFRHGTVSVKFTHAHIADAAFSVIRHKTLPFPWKSRLGPLNVIRWIIDEGGRLSTPVTDTPIDFPSIEGNSHMPYKVLRDDETNSDDHTIEKRNPLSTSLVNVSSEASLGGRNSSSSGTSTEEEELDSESSTSSESDLNGSNKYPPTSSIVPKKRTIHKIRRPSHSLLPDVQPNYQSLERLQGSTSRASTYNPVSSACKDPVPRHLLGGPGDDIRLRPALMQTYGVQKPGLNPCRLPDTPFNRPRRVLFPSHPSLPLATVSMRADVQFISRETRQRISSYSLPSQHDDTRRVNDACSIGDTIVIAYEFGPCQISLISLTKGEIPRMKDIDHKAHSKLQSNVAYSNKDTPWVSCLAPTRSINSTISFVTGGHDKSVKLWNIDTDGHVLSETITRISGPTPLALGPRDGSVLVGAGKVVFTLDMNHRAAIPVEVKLSNMIHQIHIHPNAPSITILEVDHLDAQIQIFDNRRAGFNRPPDCAFGYRSEVRSSSRYNRGSTYLSHFARGYEDGCVCIWDYRNTKHPVVMVKKDHLVQPVFHTVITSSEIVCYGVDGLAFRNYQGELL